MDSSVFAEYVELIIISAAFAIATFISLIYSENSSLRFDTNTIIIILTTVHTKKMYYGRIKHIFASKLRFKKETITKQSSSDHPANPLSPSDIDP